MAKDSQGVLFLVNFFGKHKKLILTVFAWQLLLLIVAFYAIVKIHQPGLRTDAPGNILLLRGFMNSDSIYYISIARHGYSARFLAVFYPLYPLVLRMIGRMGVGVFWAAFIVNFTSVLLASYFLSMLARDYFGEQKGTFAPKSYRVVLVFLFFPTAFFLSGLYTEAIFCALTFGAIYFARKKNWLQACLLGGLAVTTRAMGVAVVLAVIVEYFESISWKWRKISWAASNLLILPLGLILYSHYLSTRLHDSLAFLHGYRDAWRYQVLQPNLLRTIWLQFTQTSRFISNRNVGGVYGQYEALFDHLMFFGSWLLGVVFTVYGRRKRLPLSYTVYMTITLVICILNGNVVSANRYILPLFPVYILITDRLSVREPSDRFALYLAGSAATMALMMCLFANGLWTG